MKTASTKTVKCWTNSRGANNPTPATTSLLSIQYESAWAVAVGNPFDGVALYEPEEGQAAPGDVITIFLTASETISDTYIFRPLAPQLFQSDGLESRYQFQEKASTLFDKTGCAEASRLSD